MKDKKVIAIIVLSVALLIVSYIAFWNEPVPYDEKLIEKQKQEFKRQNDSLQRQIEYEKGKQAIFLTKIDSLQNLKPQIQIKYVTKYKEIDNANVGSIVSEFDTLFSNNGLKH